jgi:hypothetical protein
MSENISLVDIPQQIICVDCGGDAFMLDRYEPGEKVPAGTIVAYRCKDCLDRWDIEIGENE